MSDLAARLREAFLGTETGEAVPFDELKDHVRDRWQRVADAAAIRVPFSDDQIERMAKAAHTRRMRDEERTKHWKDLPLFAKDAWRHGIRAALAAGGLEPCAVPEYDPSDVALSPTGHVLRDRLVEAEAKIERQRKNLNQLYEARERDARLIADLRAEVDEDNAAAASVNDLLIKVQNLTAERDAQEIELADLRFYQREFAAVSADRDELRERASVPSVGPTDAQVEALARVLREAISGNKNNQPAAGIWIKEARAAIAHLNTRPEGLPTAEELLDRWAEFSVSEDTKEQFYLAALRPWLRDPVGWELDVGPIAMLKAFNAAPKGGVHRNVDDVEGMKAVLDLCRARIKPVYECKECAELRKTVESLQGLAEQASELKRELDKEQERGMALYRQYESVEAMFHNQRKINTELKDYMARLDGSPLAARAALEGE